MAAKYLLWSWAALSAAVMALVATPARAEQLAVRMSGAVTAVDPALADVFSVGQPVRFEFSMDTADLLSIRNVGSRYLAGNIQILFGDAYAVTAPGLFAELDFFYTLFGSGPTGQGFNFEHNAMSAPAVNGLPLVDTYVDLGFDTPFAGPEIAAAEILALTGEPVVAQNSFISFTFDDPKLVRFDLTSIVVTPEPLSFGVLAIPGTVVAVVRPTRGRRPAR